jgi:putative ABC transport system ATP-binding protein
VPVHALRNVDLEINAGEVVVLLGPSGSGKSTLLNIMGGLDHVTSGRLFFGGLELTNLDDRGLRAAYAYLVHKRVSGRMKGF